MDKAIHKVEVAKDVVRRKVSGEVLTVEKAVEEGLHIKEEQPALKPTESKGTPQKAGRFEEVGELTAITFTETENTLIAHLKTSKPVAKITRFWMQNPTRAVVDLRGSWRYTTARLKTFKGGFMYQVILGMHPDRLRIVFRFDDIKAPKGELPRCVRTGDGLDIIVKNSAM